MRRRAAAVPWVAALEGPRGAERQGGDERRTGAGEREEALTLLASRPLDR